MNTRDLSFAPVLIRLAVISLLLTACGPATATVTPEATQPPAATQAVPATEPSSTTMGMLALDYAALAQDVTVETVPAQPASPDAPYWATGPEYRLLTFQGYPVANSLHKPQIFVYPVADMASANEGMAGIAADLQTLLQTRDPGENLPFLPLFNAAQVMHAQVQFLDFKNGTGVRYLTQYDQAPLPINNYELIYTFQGLTSDGSYYVAAVLPVTHPDLPSSDAVNPDLVDDFQDYLARTVEMLNGQPADSFVPDLNTFDAVIRSMEVK
ncbi:MAG: hypothetical protein P8X64_01550 [Anaerolineales bacterium]|jgi:hypothetical protein